MATSQDELEQAAEELNAKYVTLSSKYRETSDVEVLREAFGFITLAVEKTASEAFASNGTRAAHLTNLGRCQGMLFESTGEKEYLDQAVDTTRLAVQTVPETSRLRPLCFLNLSDALSNRYFGSGSRGRDDYDEALEQARQAVAAANEDSQYFQTAKSTLASRLAQFYKNIESEEKYLNEAIEISEDLVRTTPESDDMYGVYVFNLAGDLQDRYHRYGNPKDLTQAKQHYARAIQLFPSGHSLHVKAVRSFAGTVWDVADATGGFDDLNRAIESLITVEAETKNEQELARIHQQSAKLYNMRYKLFSDKNDLDRAIDAAKTALEQLSSKSGHRNAFLGTLSTFLAARAEVHMSLEDIDTAIDYARQSIHAAVEVPALHAAAYGSMALRLATKYQLFGGIENLKDSLSSHRRSVALLPEDHAERPIKLHNLAISLRAHFEHYGSMIYLDESIVMERAAAAGIPKMHPDQSMALDGLSHSLSLRYKRTGDSGDLDEAIEASEAAVNGAPSGREERPAYLNSLGNRLISRFARNKDKPDLDRAIEAVEEALDAKNQDVSSKCIYLMTLANGLRSRYEEYKNLEDLELCIKKERENLEMMPSSNPNRMNAMHNLGLSLQVAYQQVEDQEKKRKYLQEALDLATEVVKGTPEKSPSMPGFMTQLASRQLYIALFMDPDDEPALFAQMAVAASTYEQAFRLTFDTPLGRITNGNLAGVLNMQSKSHKGYEKANEVLASTVNLFRRVSPITLADHDRQRQLAGLSGISSLACAASLFVGDVAKGLETLEAGRGIMANIAMGYHSDLSDVRLADANLHDEYVRLRNVLSQPLTESDGPRSHTNDIIAGRDADLAAFNDVESRIQSLPGLENFNKGLTATAMKLLAADGPIVAFCTVDLRCDAIVVTESTIEAIPLPGLKHSDLKARLPLVVGKARLSRLPPSKRAAANKKMAGLLEWIWTNAVKPVLEHLQFLGEQELPPEQKPRLWWVASGPLGLLPLHAAGKGRKAPLQNAYAHVISSYVPSFSSLAFSRRCQGKVDSASEPSMALITMPQTPGGLSPLTTEDESAAIRGAFSSSQLDSSRFHELCRPSAVQVKDMMLGSNVDIFHLACHAEPDLNDPSKTSLLFGPDLEAPEPDRLPVGQLRNLYTIPKEDRRPPRLAYLSACCTAQQYDLRLIDENIHLASAFQLYGFPAVVGTLWEADDAAAVLIANEFYQELFRLDREAAGGNRPGYHVARALDLATTRYRNKKSGRGIAADNYLAWASFVHIGA